MLMPFHTNAPGRSRGDSGPPARSVACWSTRAKTPAAAADALQRSRMCALKRFPRAGRHMLWTIASAKALPKRNLALAWDARIGRALAKRKQVSTGQGGRVILHVRRVSKVATLFAHLSRCLKQAPIRGQTHNTKILTGVCI